MGIKEAIICTNTEVYIHNYVHIVPLKWNLMLASKRHT